MTAAIPSDEEADTPTLTAAQRAEAAVAQEADADNDALDEFDEKLAAFNVLRKSDVAAADALLAQIGGNDGVDRDILAQMAAKLPLGRPGQFPAAHARAMRSLEVLDRNGARGVRTGAPGPLEPVAAWLVQLVARYLVRSYQASAIDNIRKLYARREANCLPDYPHRRMLVRARRDAERVSPGFKSNPLGIPTFLLGGAVISGLAGLSQNAIRAAGASTWAKVAATALVFGVFSAVAWVVIRGAAVARRRIRMTTDGPLQGLYDVVGKCGDPPRDQARQFALIAVILMAVAWLIVPIGALVAWLT